MDLSNISTGVPVKVQESTSTSMPSPSQGAMDKTDKLQDLNSVEKLDQTAKGKEQKESPLSADNLKELTEELNEYMDDLQTNIGFSMRDDPDRTLVVEIKNRETGEVIKQIPSEEMLKLREKMAELTGLIFDKSV
ncbi:MAG: flagellar protein FlaG [Desulfobacteraceae bacterium]|nr:flagellar protein FlaG [Desulfobacteraceae bacterium]